MRAQLEPKEEWFRKAAEAEGNGIVEDLERGFRLLDTRDVSGAVAKALDLPAEKLLAAAGLNGSPDPELSSAVLRFAAEAQPSGRLSPSEEAALKHILHALAVA